MGVWGAALQGVLGADSAIQGGKAEGKQAEANTEIAKQAEADALRRGGKEAGEVRAAGSALAARQFVAFTSSGVDASVGTPAQVQVDTLTKSELDAKIVENNAAREAWGYKKHGLNFQTQAAINTSRRDRELAGGIIGTAGEVASAYSKKGWGI